MSKTTDTWFRILKGIPLTEQKTCMPGTAYNPSTRKCEPIAAPAQKQASTGGGVATIVAKDAPVSCNPGTQFNPKTKRCERQMSKVRQIATKKIQQVAEQPSKGRPAVRLAQSVVGDIIFGDAHLPEKKRKLKVDGLVGPNTLRAFANIGIDPSFIGEDPKDRKNWRMATRNIEIIRKALAKKYNAALPYIGVAPDKALAVAQAVKAAPPAALADAPKGRPAEDITGEGKAEVPIASWYGKITPAKGGRKLSSITSIVLHDTLTSLGGMIAAFSKPRTYTSKRTGGQSTYYTGTHFSIDKSGNVRQHAPLNRPTNHTAAGGWNKKSVGIDMVTRAGGVGAGYIGFDPPTAAQLSALYDLVNQLKSKIPSIDDTIHWMDDGEKNNAGWQLGGKQYSLSGGIVSHGMVQGNRADATISSYYLKLRSDGMSHNEAFQKSVEDEQQARVRYADSDKGASKMKKLQRLALGKGRRAARAKRALSGIEAIKTGAV
tara:strand:- start:2091 stop:3557 length:1467 start_codon:yes stop_codon:yes gene_type:complete